MTLLKLGLLTSLLAALIACGGDDDAAQTARPTATSFAVTTVASSPTPPVTVEPTAEASPAVAATAEPTARPAPQVQPTVAPATAAPSGPVTLNIVARALAFDRTAITVPANASITVNFRNDDTLVAHDFGVSIPFVPHTETCNGPCSATLTFNSGPPGNYTFQCSVHADMVGPFIVN